uniref:Uncharacterized protein n=1 Tax=Knipowitschia caucasica TaxID=637954 RepID=A0AAV2MM60_KNICA
MEQACGEGSAGETCSVNKIGPPRVCERISPSSRAVNKLELKRRRVASRGRLEPEHQSALEPGAPLAAGGHRHTAGVQVKPRREDPPTVTESPGPRCYPLTAAPG